MNMKDETTSNITEKNLVPIITKTRSLKRRREIPQVTRSVCILCGYNEPDVSYHRFPTNKTRNEWLRLCDLPESTKTTRSLKICGRHFAENQKWYAADGSVRLNYGAVPGLNLEIYGLNTSKNESSSLGVQQSRNCAADEPSFQTSTESYSESSEKVELENNFVLKNTMNIELVEVVEMKIYRCNPPTTAETAESFILPDTEPFSPTFENDLENESNTRSNTSMNVKGLEMHSYSKPASESTGMSDMANKEPPQCMRRFKALRYFGDLQKEDFASPDTAKHCWRVAKSLIEKRNEKILSLEEENKKLVRRLKNIKEILRQLRMTGSIPSKYRKNVVVEN